MVVKTSAKTSKLPITVPQPSRIVRIVIFGSPERVTLYRARHGKHTPIIPPRGGAVGYLAGAHWKHACVSVEARVESVRLPLLGHCFTRRSYRGAYRAECS